MLLRRMDLSRGGSNGLFAFILLHFVVFSSCQIDEPPQYSYHNMPQTRFTCEGKLPGRYYADQETDCQLFHVCVKMRRDLQDFKFLCPNGTVFDQEHLVCADYYQVVCHSQVGNNPFGQIFELFKLSASKPDIGMDFRVPERDPDYLGQNTIGGEEFQAEEYNNNKFASSANSLPFAEAGESQKTNRRPFTTSGPSISPSSTTTQRSLIFRSPLPSRTPSVPDSTRRTPAVTTTTTTTTTPTTTRITTQRTYDDDFFNSQQSTAFPFNPFDTVEISTSVPSNTRRPSVFQSTFRTSLPILSAAVTKSPLASQTQPPTFQQQSTRFSDEFFVKLPISSRPKVQQDFFQLKTTEEPFYTTTTTRTPTTTDRFFYTTTQQDSFVRPTTFNPSSFQKSNNKFSLKTMSDGKSKFLVKPTEIPSSLESETLNYFEPKKSSNNNLVFYNEEEFAETTTPSPTTTTLLPRRIGRRRKVNGQKSQFRPFDPQVQVARRTESRANQQKETVFASHKQEEIFSAEASVFPGRPKGNIISNGEVAPLPQRKDGSGELSRENKEKFKKPTFNGDAFGRRIRPFIRDFNKQDDFIVPDEEKPLRRRRPSTTTTTVATTTDKSEEITSTTVTSSTRESSSEPNVIFSPSTLKPGRIQIRTKTVFGGTRKSQDPSSSIFLAEPKRIVTSTEEPELITASDEDIAAKKSVKNSHLKLTVITTPVSVLFKPNNSTQVISVKSSSIKKSESFNPQQPPFTKKIVKIVKKPKEKIPENDVEFGTRSPDYDYSYYNTDDELAITSDVAKHDKELFIKKN